MEPITIPQTTQEKLRKLGVAALYLYGSRAMGVAGENSDYDVGVLFSIPPTESLSTEAYGALYDSLCEIFPDMPLGGPKLDIAILQQANAALQMSAIQHGIVVFESDPRVRANYEESVVKQYDDYRFLQKEYEDASFAAFRDADKAYA